jgi:multicomponent Na+:H+ antiporter subunit G
LIEFIAYIFLGIGGACALVGAMGILRFPDVYNRLHANTVIVVGGVIMTLLGVGVLAGLSVYSLKALLIAVFLFLTNPVGAHAIARAAHKSGIKLWPRSVVDKLEEEEKR